MATYQSHTPGSFCWIELATTDQAAAKSFYTSLLGWLVNDMPMGPGQFYSMFQREGSAVGAAFTLRPDMLQQGVPPHWLVYIAVANADETAQRAAELGGAVVAPAFDVMDAGRMAVLRDPTGAVFAVWQAGRHIGMQRADEVNTFCWADLSTPSAEKAGHFYAELFGWEMSLAPNDPSGYIHIKNGGRFIGGIPPAAQRDPAIPPHWMIWFAVADCDKSTQAVQAAGGKVLRSPMTMDRVGRLSVVNDPQGAGFGLITPEQHARG
ncbi:MAG TPA: VOC family protein [Terriglobales bacterium]|nr:VOC family protein [Terriglobales bacterium]